MRAFTDPFTESLTEPITGRSLGEWKGREWKRNGREMRRETHIIPSPSVTRESRDGMMAADAAQGWAA